MAHIAQYMGPVASFNYNLWKLSVIFDTMASFDVLMPKFYKVSQGNNEKVPSFCNILEGTLKQIHFQCPWKMMDQEAQQHLQDCMFNGVKKNHFDLIQYLYSTLGVSYL